MPAVLEPFHQQSCSLFPVHFAVPAFPTSLQAVYPSQVTSYGLPIHSLSIVCHPIVCHRTLGAAVCVNPALPSALRRGTKPLLSLIPKSRLRKHKENKNFRGGDPDKEQTLHRAFSRTVTFTFCCCCCSPVWVKLGFSQSLPLENVLLTTDVAKAFLPLEFLQKTRKIRLFQHGSCPS